jgi:hypothetical protein
MSDSEVPANCVELCLERIQEQYLGAHACVAVIRIC